MYYLRYIYKKLFVLIEEIKMNKYNIIRLFIAHEIHNLFIVHKMFYLNNVYNLNCK